MRTKRAASVIVVILFLVAAWAAYGQSPPRNQVRQRGNAPGATQEQFERWMTET